MPILTKEIAKNAFTSFVKGIVIDVLKHESSKPFIKKLKPIIGESLIEYKVEDIWDLIYNNPYEISLCVRYLKDDGKEFFKVYSSYSIEEFKDTLKNFEPIFNIFKTVSLHIKPNKNDLSKIQSLTGVTNNVYYKTQFKILFEPILEWMDNRPEMFI